MDIDIRASNSIEQNKLQKSREEVYASHETSPVRVAMRVFLAMVIFTVIVAYGARLVLAHYGINV